MKNPPVVQPCPKCGSNNSNIESGRQNGVTKHWLSCPDCGFVAKAFTCLNDAKKAWNDGIER